MNQLLPFVLIPCVGYLTIFILGRIALRWSAPIKIRQAFEEKGFPITRIRRSKGWLDCGSFWRAVSTKAYEVTVIVEDGHESERFCLVRYIPIIGIARSVEIWPTETENA